MEGDLRGALRKRPGPPSKKKGGNKKGKWNDFSREHNENTQLPSPSDTVYRILCPSRKIGCVIGKGGGIIKALREETMAKITVSESVPGSDDRVVMIFSSPENSKKQPDERNKGEFMTLHCPAQDALLKIHDRIIKEDLSGEMEDDEDNNTVVTARLLVPHNMVGCILGKGGDVIQRLRSETGASIRVLPAEHLPACALSTDELAQIQGKPSVLKKALYEISTLLHQNPRKEKALNFAMPSRGPGFHPAGPPVTNLPPPHNPMWSPRNPSPHMPPPPWMEDYGARPRFMQGRFDDGLTKPGVDASGEFSLKILCLASKVGGVIGRGGINVRQLEQETGTSIHVEDASAMSEERVIRVSAFETLRNPRSQTIDAIILLQNKVSDVSEKGIITTRLLIPSSKAGCILGQGGAVINEMRRRTQADIRVHSKEDEKPKCASDDEELVQISGSFVVAKDALAEIASRLRARCLKDGSADAEPAPFRAAQGFSPGGSLPRGGPTIPGPVGMGSSGGYNTAQGRVHNYEPPNYSVQPSASRYLNTPDNVEVRYSDSTIGPISGAGGSIYANTREAPRSMKLHDPYVGGSESMVIIRGGPDHFNAPPVSYPNPYPKPNPDPISNPSGQGGYYSMTPQQANQNPHQTPYQQSTAQPSPYPNMNAQHGGYQSVSVHGAYQY